MDFKTACTYLKSKLTTHQGL